VTTDFLVTGGAGFIGCALSRQLLAEASDVPGPSIVAVDSLHPQVHPERKRPADLPEPVELKVMDICEPEGWQAVLAEFRPAIVVHLAAETGTGQSLDEPARHTEVNVTGTARMLEAFDRANHRPQQIVLASSRAVYGEGRWLDPTDGSIFNPDHRSVEQLVAGQFDVIAPSGARASPLPHDERTTTPLPTSVYGVTKHAQEQILRLWCIARGVPLSILRLQNVYGPGQSPHNPYTGIVGLFHRVAAAGSAIEVYEDGRIGRDFVFIDDVASCLAAAVRNPPESSRLVDVGTGIATTIWQAASDIAALYAAPEPRVTGAFRHGDIRWAVAATERMKEDLGRVAAISFAEGNRRLAQWLRA
jgi:dTDP-L-rhamnose 4-epimerase